MASHPALSSDSSTLLQFRGQMGMKFGDSSISPFAMIECGEDADLMSVLARLRDKFDGLPSALAMSRE
jgi:hypothetical protein